MPSIYSRDIYGASHGLRPWRDRSEQKRIPHLHEVDFASLARWVSWGSEKASYLPKVTQWVRGCPSSNLELLTTVPSPFQYKAGKYLTGCQAKKELFGSKCFKCVDSLQQLILETRKWRSERLGNWPRVTQLVRSRDEMGNLSRPAQSRAFSSSSTWPFKVIIQEMVGFIFILITIVFIFVSGDSTHVWGMTQITLCGMEGSRNEGTDFFNLEGDMPRYPNSDMTYHQGLGVQLSWSCFHPIMKPLRAQDVENGVAPSSEQAGLKGGGAVGRSGWHRWLSLSTSFPFPPSVMTGLVLGVPTPQGCHCLESLTPHILAGLKHWVISGAL